jgi:nickel transport protein
MRSLGCCRPTGLGLVLPVLLFAGFASPACAHNVEMFATVNGTTIEGRAYTSDLSPVAEAAVSLFSTDGQQLAQTTTDADGRFTFSVNQKADYRLELVAPGGHRAEFPLSREEFSTDVPATEEGAAESTKPRPESASPSPAHAASEATPVDSDSLGNQIDQLRRQVVQLREQIAAYEQKRRWSDVLGGIGYILGIMGVAFYFLGVRRKERQETGARRRKSI